MNKFFANNGFVIFTQMPGYAAGLIIEYLTIDQAIRNAVIVPCKQTDPFVLAQLSEAIENSGVNLDVISFEDYGTPANMYKVGSIPSDQLLLIILDMRFMIANRLDTRLDYLQNMHRAHKKVVIEALPYMVQPWKV